MDSITLKSYTTFTREVTNSISAGSIDITVVECNIGAFIDIYRGKRSFEKTGLNNHDKLTHALKAIASEAIIACTHETASCILTTSIRRATAVQTLIDVCVILFSQA